MMKKTYTVAQAGLGIRGDIHLRGISKNADRLELVAICDINQERMAEMAKAYDVSKTYADAETMLAETRPDVFVFVTHPQVRVDMIKLAVKYKVKAIAFEKPMATSIQDAAEITRLCEENGIKTIVSHQHKYLPSFLKMKETIDTGGIGDIVQLNISTQPWMSHLGTHFMDYAMWANNGNKAKWTVGHVHGAKLLTDSHPSAEYIMGQVAFENGVRLFMENGYMSKSTVATDIFWVDNRLTVYGTKGHVWAETDGAWGGHANGHVIGGQCDTYYVAEPDLQIGYFRDFINWLDDDSAVHSCDVSTAYHGFEILEAMCLSALDNKPVHFPVDVAEMPDIIERMKAELT